MRDVVGLSDNLLFRYTDRDLTDLAEYFDPSVVLIEGNPTEGQVERLESLIRAEVLSQKEGPVCVELGGGTLGLVNSPSGVGELPQREDLCIVSDFIERRTDMRTFETELVNFPEYRNEVERLDSDPKAHLTTTVESGESVSKGGLEVHGIGTKETMNGTEVPAVDLDGPFFEPLSADRVGLRAVPEVGRKAEKRLKRKGYESREDLSDADPEDLMKIEGVGAHYASLYSCGAKAIQQDTVFRFDEDPLRDKKRVYVDIETDSLNPEVIWQIGVYDEPEGEYMYFLEDEKPGRKDAVVREFAEWLEENARDKTLVSWYGKKFDYEHLGRFIEEYAPEKRQVWQETEKVDLLLDVAKSCVALPTRSFRLEAVARRLGYEREKKGLSGTEGARKYVEWISGGEQPDWQRWVSYCRDDVVSMKHIYDRILQAPKPVDKTRLEKVYKTGNESGSLGEY